MKKSPTRRPGEIRFASDDALSPLIWRYQRGQHSGPDGPALLTAIDAELTRRARGWGARSRIPHAQLDEFASGLFSWLLTDRRDEIARWDPRINARFWAFLVRCFALHRYRTDFLARFAPAPLTSPREPAARAPVPGGRRWVALDEGGDQILRIASRRGAAHLATFVLAHFDWFAEYAARLRAEAPETDPRAERLARVQAAIAEQTRRPYDPLARELTARLVDRGDRRITTLPGALVGQLLGISRAAVNVRVHRVRRDLARALAAAAD